MASAVFVFTGSCDLVVVTVLVGVLPVDRGDIIFLFLWASKMVFDGLHKRLGFWHLCGGMVHQYQCLFWSNRYSAVYCLRYVL